VRLSCLHSFLAAASIDSSQVAGVAASMAPSLCQVSTHTGTGANWTNSDFSLSFRSLTLGMQLVRRHPAPNESVGHVASRRTALPSSFHMASIQAAEPMTTSQRLNHSHSACSSCPVRDPFTFDASLVNKWHRFFTSPRE
jgi:hypothetical protein